MDQKNICNMRNRRAAVIRDEGLAAAMGATGVESAGPYS